MKSFCAYTVFLSLFVSLMPTDAFPATPWGSRQLVDLRSFFHGDPPPPPKAPPPKHLAIVSTAATVTTDIEIENFMRAFADAIKARDGKPMLARLSAKYTIDGLPDDKKAADFFMQAIVRIPGAIEIIIKSVERKDGIRTAKIEFRYSLDSIKLKTFRFDADCKLVWSDLFALQRQAQGA